MSGAARPTIAATSTILIIANLNPVDHQCAWQFPGIVSCLLSARETLAAGMIGTGGAVFAGWLAYSAALEATDHALAEARAAKRDALEGRIADYCDEIDRLKLAGGYLETFASNFSTTAPGSPSTGLAATLRECHARALDFVSSSAIRAPFGYGSQISTVMNRVQTLGDRIETMLLNQPVISIDQTWGADIFNMIAGIRSLAAQIGADIPIHEKHLLRLTDERDAMSQR